MSSGERKTDKLQNLCLKIGSGATPRGGKEAYLPEGLYSLIRSQNVLDFSFSSNGLAFISEAQANQLSNVEVQEDDVLLNIRDLEYSKIPFIMFSYCKKGGIAYEDINFGSKWCVV